MVARMWNAPGAAPVICPFPRGAGPAARGCAAPRPGARGADGRRCGRDRVVAAGRPGCDPRPVGDRMATPPRGPACRSPARLALPAHTRTDTDRDGCRHPGDAHRADRTERSTMSTSAQDRLDVINVVNLYFQLSDAKDFAGARALLADKLTVDFGSPTWPSPQPGSPSRGLPVRAACPSHGQLNVIQVFS